MRALGQSDTIGNMPAPLAIVLIGVKYETALVAVIDAKKTLGPAAGLKADSIEGCCVLRCGAAEKMEDVALPFVALPLEAVPLRDRCSTDGLPS